MEQMIFPRLVLEEGIWGWKHKGYWYDIGTIPDYLRANKELLARFHASKPSKITAQSTTASATFTFQLLESRSGTGETGHGATIKQPSFVGEGSTLHRGTTLGPGTILSRGVEVDEGSTIRDSIIFEYTSLGRDCVVDGAIVGERVTVGAGTRIGRGAMIAGEVSIPGHSLIKQKAVVLN